MTAAVKAPSLSKSQKPYPSKIKMSGRMSVKMSLGKSSGRPKAAARQTRCLISARLFHKRHARVCEDKWPEREDDKILSPRAAARAISKNKAK